MNSLPLACPFCGTETSRLVWEGIFNDEFWVNGAMVLSSFPLLMMAVGVVHFRSQRLK